MNVYQVGYSSYEECPHVTLLHTETFTEQDFSDMLVEYIKTRKDLPDKKWKYRNNIGNIIDGGEPGGNFIHYLIEKKGFVKQYIACTFMPFGWASVFTDGDWGSERGKTVNYITKKLKGN